MMTYNLSRREYRKVEKKDKGVAASHIGPCLRSTVKVAAESESSGSGRERSKMMLELSASRGDEESKNSVAKDAFVVEDSRSGLSISSVEEGSSASGGVTTEGGRIGMGRTSIFKVDSRSPAAGR